MENEEYALVYNRAMTGIEDMLVKGSVSLDSFKKALYPSAFQEYLGRFSVVFSDIEEIYQEEEDKQAWLDRLADRLVDAARRELEAIPKKGKRSEQQINYNMMLATYIFPSFLEQKNESGPLLVDTIVDKWNEAFKTSVGKGTYEEINAGFHRRYCFITTAVCESLDKGDDCYELNLLRSYRDGYLMTTEEGRAQVDEYYEIAPEIVECIDALPDSREIYREIWEGHLKQCISLIEAGENEACREKYKNMVYELKGRYLA